MTNCLALEAVNTAIADARFSAGERPRCSTGIHDWITRGYGKLDYNGFWQYPLPDEEPVSIKASPAVTCSRCFARRSKYAMLPWSTVASGRIICSICQRIPLCQPGAHGFRRMHRDAIYKVGLPGGTQAVQCGRCGQVEVAK